MEGEIPRDLAPGGRDHGGGGRNPWDTGTKAVSPARDKPISPASSVFGLSFRWRLFTRHFQSQDVISSRYLGPR